MNLTQLLIALITFGAMVSAAPTNSKEKRPTGKFNLGLEGNLDLEGDLGLFGDRLIGSPFSEYEVAIVPAPVAPVPAAPAPAPAVPASVALAANDLRNPSGDSVIVVVDAKNH
ncbi:hypothetical protein G6F55_003906 [Rhizopus delemar]|uniref:Uncharacterized protein n=3 Tax=Rhizopus TaxID=4842 RepID=I1BTS6_RHIO9|nr:hypothetical protein RO3G_04311 [Rhizopus delemar RA 99-880]KAG1460870.1 hypothetical protein G6F55_003906 [Rhizopus delemar]KAG1545553.1 hypothetical protein G6F51_005395 [Rhizopus arrhizus]KAG1501065.1 hypothetical protein G6F54_003292 [Rhizopus delemar]KAG1512979.1 hypothetical protein G6F53_004780 [Rhizopus delemar]|eukprot:EIE79606.1 hypothetical protein RO3G_04311 [Rhizopus delemar RA 99-880]